MQIQYVIVVTRELLS
ncbi:CPXV031 protein [Cowpox virus]|uniref:CPXV031 protein n=1 Tax=Cowpox virus TaxID=10243 RepID=U5TE26_COWPX|nr:CPXV031 protein [Cowpox virus]